MNNAVNSRSAQQFLSPQTIQIWNKTFEVTNIVDKNDKLWCTKPSQADGV